MKTGNPLEPATHCFLFMKCWSLLEKKKDKENISAKFNNTYIQKCISSFKVIILFAVIV